MRFVTILVALMLATLPSPAAADAIAASQRARSGDFDGMGNVRCAQNAGEALDTCKAAFADAQNSTVVVVTFPSSFKRMLTLSDERFVRGNATMSGVGTDTEWHLAEGTYHIRVDDQRFEIPQHMIQGDMAAPTE